ncbi:MAG: Gfo/Idh/MocA family protein [Planctomycetota bacterium]
MTSGDPIKVAAIGVGGFGRWTLQALHALARVGEVELVGLSDRAPRIAAEAGQEMGVPHFSDNRSLLAETRPEIAFVAVPPMVAPDVIALCAERGVHVWKELPLARNLDEAAAIVRRMEDASLKLAVGTQWRFAAGYRRARELLDALGEVFLARAHYLFNWGPMLTWRGDRSSAGGGALLELGYHAVDLLLWLLGVPEEVYGVSAGNNRPDCLGPQGQPLPPYDTDDTAAAVLRFTGGRMASMVTSRFSGPVSEGLWLHGRGGSLAAKSETCLLRDPNGTILEDYRGEPRPLDTFQRQAAAFVHAVRSGTERYACSGRENLLNVAVIDALYLANRTSQPEKPLDLLQVQGLTAAKCHALRPLPDDEQTPPKPGGEGKMA